MVNANKITEFNREIQRYEAFLGQRVGWLERLGDAFSGLDERIDYTNRLLIRGLVAAGVPIPPAVGEPTPTTLPGVVIGIQIPALVVPLGRPISRVNSITTVVQDVWQEVVKWTIPARHTGELQEISMTSDTLAKTLFRLVIAGEEQWTDEALPGPLTLPWTGNRLYENMVMAIFVKSSDGTSITAFGSITGKQIPPQG